MERQNKLAWITGAGGLIGNYLVQAAPKFAPQWRLHALTRDQLDLLDFAAVRREFEKDRPQLVIHCAAISNVADAQKNPELAWRLNVEVTRLIAELAAEIQFVFFSTDLVFDGRKGNYVETDAVNPIHVYGETKATAEEILLKNPKHTIVRASINGGVSRAGNRGFNEQLRQTLLTKSKMKLFTDEFRCPIPAVETARAVWELAGKNCAGIYHVAGAEKLSRWQIGQLAGQTLAGNKNQNRTGFGEGFYRPGARTGHVAEYFQGASGIVRAIARIGRMAGGKSQRKVLKVGREASSRAGSSVASPYRNYFAFNSRIVMEYGGNSRVKSVPSPSTVAVAGTIFVGSSIEFVSSGLSAFSTMAVPSASTVETPLI